MRKKLHVNYEKPVNANKYKMKTIYLDSHTIASRHIFVKISSKIFKMHQFLISCNNRIIKSNYTDINIYIYNCL